MTTPTTDRSGESRQPQTKETSVLKSAYVPGQQAIITTEGDQPTRF